MLLLLTSSSHALDQPRPAAGAPRPSRSPSGSPTALTNRAGRRRAAGGQPRRHRLGRGRLPLRRRDDRLSRRPSRRADPPARGPRRRRRLRAGHGLRRGPALPQRRAPLLRRRPGDRRARHPGSSATTTATAGPTNGRVVLTGFRRGEHPAPGQRPVPGARQLDLRGQRPERRRGPHAGVDRRARPCRSAAATCGSGSGPTRRTSRSRRSPASASSAWPTTTGATASPPGTRSRSATSSSSRPTLDRNPFLAETSSVAPILDESGWRPGLFHQSGPGPVQSRVGRLFQRELRPDDLPRRPASPGPIAVMRSSASR